MVLGRLLKSGDPKIERSKRKGKSYDKVDEAWCNTTLNTAGNMLQRSAEEGGKSIGLRYRSYISYQVLDAWGVGDALI